jgi:hypothetical protein
METISQVAKHLRSAELQGLKPLILSLLNVAAEAATHKDDLREPVYPFQSSLFNICEIWHDLL